MSSLNERALPPIEEGGQFKLYMNAELVSFRF